MKPLFEDIQPELVQIVQTDQSSSTFKLWDHTWSFCSWEIIPV